MDFVIEICSAINPDYALAACCLMLLVYCVTLSLRISKMSTVSGVAGVINKELERTRFKAVGPTSGRLSGRSSNPYDAGANRR